MGGDRPISLLLHHLVFASILNHYRIKFLCEETYLEYLRIRQTWKTRFETTLITYWMFYMPNIIVLQCKTKRDVQTWRPLWVRGYYGNSWEIGVWKLPSRWRHKDVVRLLWATFPLPVMNALFLRISFARGMLFTKLPSVMEGSLKEIILYVLPSVICSIWIKLHWLAVFYPRI